MPLIGMKDLIDHAYANAYAVGAYQVVDSNFVSAILDAAEAEQAPVILNFVEAHGRHYDFPMLLKAAEWAASRASVPVSLVFDHATDTDFVATALELGCSGVMADFSGMSFADNVRATKAVVDLAHGKGVAVEGELGYVPGVYGDEALLHPGQMRLTEPQEAVEFIAATGIDSLAVAVGTVHGHLTGEPRLDLKRLAEISESVHLPLVVHGGSGLADDEYRGLVECGVAKINYFTGLSDLAASAASNTLADIDTGYLHALDAVREAVTSEAARTMKIFGSSGQAPGLISSARRRIG